VILRRRIAIEIKRTSSPRPRKGFLLGCQDIGATERYVVTPRQEKHPLGHDTEAVGLRGMIEILLAAGV
jgi:hypothetical protein